MDQPVEHAQILVGEVEVLQDEHDRLRAALKRLLSVVRDEAKGGEWELSEDDADLFRECEELVAAPNPKESEVDDG